MNLASPRSSTLTTLVGIDQQVGRLDVAVDQAGQVGVGQALGGLADVLGGAGVAQRPFRLDDLLQVPALDVLHDQEVDVAFVVHVVGADDVGVVQRGGGLGLALEAGQVGSVVHPVLGQHLDRHAAAASARARPGRRCSCPPCPGARAACTS